jgi:hypothetical protein
MIKASTTGVLTATLALATVLATGFVISSPLDASAHVAGEADKASERVEGAFAAMAQAGIETGFTGRPVPVDCETAVWPHIDASCLAGADGSASAIRVIY